MIVGFGGRMRSGKTTLSNELVNNGFIKIAFADYLKKIISSLYNFDLNLLYSQNGKEETLSIPLIWDINVASDLFKMVGINDFNLNIENTTFCSRREAMQYIGTNILRKYDDSFHIKKTIIGIHEDKNYVCEDFRYLNELEALKNINALCYFIIRPNMFDFSNHKSEISLNWSHFNNILINNIEEQQFIKYSMNAINNYNYIPNSRKNHIVLTKKILIDELNNNNFDTAKVASVLKCSRDKIVWWSSKYGINIRNSTKYNYDNSAFLIETPEAAYYAGLLSADGCIKKSGRSKYNYVLELSSNNIELVSGFKKFIKTDKQIYKKTTKNSNINYYLTVNNPYIIENLKFWNIRPKKSKYNEIPDIIKDNNELIKFWVLGLIDGDGSVYFHKKDYPAIKILASKEIIEFLAKLFCNLYPYIKQEKKIDNLYNLYFYGEKAIELYKLIYQPIALGHKWNKLKQYV